MENPIKMDDLGVPLLLETPILIIIEAHDHLHSLPKHHAYTVIPPPILSQ